MATSRIDMKPISELLFYVMVSSGMALATSAFTIFTGMFEVADCPAVLAGILLSGVICCAISLSIGELASMYPSAPGIRTYLKDAFGDRVSLFVVYLYLVSVVLIAGLESFIFSEVVRALFPGVSPLGVIVGLLGLVMFINLLGLSLPRWLQIVSTVIAVGLIIWAASKGALNPHYQLFPPTAHKPLVEWIRPLLATTGMAVFLYMGFEWVTPLGFSPTSYRWMVPASMPIAIALLGVVYLSFAVGLSYQVSRETIISATVPQVIYFKTVFASKGAVLALCLAIMTTLSTFNAGIMGGSRLIFFLAAEGRLPLWCGSLSKRTGAPLGSTVLLGTLALASAIIVMTCRVEIVVALVGACIICAVYGAFMLAVLLLRERKPNVNRRFRTPIWRSAQTVTLLLLPLIGAGMLFSQPGLALKPAGVLVASLAGALVLTWWFRGIPNNAQRLRRHEL